MLKSTATVASGALKEQAVLRLQDALAEIPFVSKVSIKKPLSTVDSAVAFTATVRIRRPGGLQPIDRRLLCQAKTSGQPRIAREACLRLAEELQMSPSAYPVFLAPFISPAAAAICDRYNTGYIDLAGNCRLCFDTVYIRKEGSPNPAVHKRDLRSLYSPKAERVLRVLLAAGPRTWRTQALADAAEVSLGQVANVKKLLADREWITSSPAGISVAGYGLRSADGSVDGSGNGGFQVAAAPMIAEWAKSYRASRNESLDFYSMKPVPEIEARLAETGTSGRSQIALTGFSAAARFAPTVRYQRASAYVGADIDAVARELALKPVSSGANVTLIRPYDDGVFYGAAMKDGAPIVSAIQAYLDLTATPGRGEEAAQAILEEVIEPQWR